MVGLWLYFTDPVLRAPTLGSMFMCLATAMVGVVVVLRKQSLLGECLSHASYPGVILGTMAAAGWTLGGDEEHWLTLVLLGGAFVSSLLGLWCVERLRIHFSVPYDSAMCVVLSSFFGIGVTLASRVQFTQPVLYQKIQVYLYGQAATMRDFHVVLYASLVMLTALVLASFYKEFQVYIFDRDYARCAGIPVSLLEAVFSALMVFAVLIGIRCVGVVLISAMLVAPAVAARQFTNSLWKMILIAGGIGLASGFFGNFLSAELGAGRFQVMLATGPTIVLSAIMVTLLALLLAPQRGWFFRLFRLARFRVRSLQENLLKSCWRLGPRAVFTAEDLQPTHLVPGWYLSWLLRRLLGKEWLVEEGTGQYRLSDQGSRQAARIVRLHRLWELYLVECVGMKAERVHHTAEEMEHVLTPDLEARLTAILHNPLVDPHRMPIPPRPVDGEESHGPS